MTIAQINLLSQTIATGIFNQFINQPGQSESYNSSGVLQGNFSSAFNHKGLYAFILVKNGTRGIVYVGKSESDKDRLRQELTGQNKNGTPLKSTHHKNSDIKEAISNGFQVELALYPDPDFNKSSLACLEIEVILLAKDHLKTSLNIPTWNTRIG